MKTKTIKLYTAKELKKKFPDGFSRAHERYQETYCREIPWGEETIDSLKTIIKDAGLRLKDYDLGEYNRGNSIRVEFPQEEAGDLSGGRAMAWLENNLLSKYRRPCNSRVDDWRKQYDETGHFKTGYKLDESARYYRTGQGIHSRGFPGTLDSCPATGVCFDEDYLDALRQALRDGDTLKEAFESLADVCMRLLEAEDESNRSEEMFLENAEDNEWTFTQDGRRED